MNCLSLIESKRDGHALTADELCQAVSAFTAGGIPDYQMAAFLMAVYFQGLSPEETRALTLAMRDSGDVLSFPMDERPLVDKHSTGGIGDKVSLPLAPLLACLGFRVPMIAGRGLGITGGTLDKLDSIPGFKTALAPEQIRDIVQDTGCVISGQTERMAPADRAMYALRDVTGTVPSIPLIVASILSKKLAEGLQALLLDVKFGGAAFMPTKEKARELARAMVAIGTECGVRTRALLTAMDTPLGQAAGNWPEVVEAVHCLEGHGPADLEELVLACAAHLLLQTGREPSLASALDRVRQCLVSGRPRQKWDEMLKAQGADLERFNQRMAQDHTAPVLLELRAWKSGIISRCDARILGEAIRDMGAGRLRKQAALDYEAGVDCLAKIGESVETGSLLARFQGTDAVRVEAARERSKAAFTIAEEKPDKESLIAEVLSQ
jgi:pyrimidine-nucleoside phosphorylase